MIDEARLRELERLIAAEHEVGEIGSEAWEDCANQLILSGSDLIAAARERNALREKLAAQPQIQVLSDGIDEAVQLAEQRIAELERELERELASLRSIAACERCGGVGSTHTDYPCPSCRGKGSLHDQVAALTTALESQRQASEEAMRRAEEARRELAEFRVRVAENPPTEGDPK